MTVNKAIIVGHLGADPELRTTTSGNAVCNLRIATSDRKKDNDGNWTDHTEWHNVVCFGKTAENVAKFCRKGRQVYAEGRIQTRKWEDKDGADRWSTEVVAYDVKFLGRNEDDTSPKQQRRQPQKRTQKPASGGYGQSGGGYGGGSGGPY